MDMGLESINLSKVNMKIAICFGTRPEIIKLSLLSEKLSKKFDVINVFTGQHDSLFEDVKHLIPDVYALPFGPSSDLNGLYSSLIRRLGCCFYNEKPDLVIVQGDTASSFCAAFCAFILGIKVGHVEAGLRTYDVDSPFPEEFNRQAIDKIAYYNWAPSKLALKNLLSENISGKIILTGNTIVDFVNQMTIDKDEFYENDEIVITLHRRENEKLFKSILTQICEISQEYSNLKFIFSAHPNPIIQSKLDGLATSNFEIIPPMKYEKFLTLLARCRGIITDSGGIQEEALCLKKKVLVCRSNTERPEGVNIGLCKLIGSEVKKNFKWLLEEAIVKFENPYGDGTACDKIIESIEAV